MNLITVAEYKSYYNISNPADDAKISILIDSVSILIEGYLSLSFSGNNTVTETLSLDYETDSIYLENYPLSSVTIITESDRTLNDSTIHLPLSNPSDYYVNLQEGILYRTGICPVWSTGPGSVVVTYVTAPALGLGSTATMPADLKLAAIQLVSYYKSEDWKAKTIQGSSTNSIPATPEYDFPYHIQILLDRYI